MYKIPKQKRKILGSSVFKFYLISAGSFMIKEPMMKLIERIRVAVRAILSPNLNWILTIIW